MSFPIVDYSLISLIKNNPQMVDLMMKFKSNEQACHVLLNYMTSYHYYFSQDDIRYIYNLLGILNLKNYYSTNELKKIYVMYQKLVKEKTTDELEKKIIDLQNSLVVLHIVSDNKQIKEKQILESALYKLKDKVDEYEKENTKLKQLYKGSLLQNKKDKDDILNKDIFIKNQSDEFMKIKEHYENNLLKVKHNRKILFEKKKINEQKIDGLTMALKAKDKELSDFKDSCKENLVITSELVKINKDNDAEINKLKEMLVENKRKISQYKINIKGIEEKHILHLNTNEELKETIKQLNIEIADKNKQIDILDGRLIGNNKILSDTRCELERYYNYINHLVIKSNMVYNYSDELVGNSWGNVFYDPVLEPIEH